MRDDHLQVRDTGTADQFAHGGGRDPTALPGRGHRVAQLRDAVDRLTLPSTAADERAIAIEEQMLAPRRWA